MRQHIKIIASQLLLFAASIAVSSCPLTFVAQFEYTCDKQGWVTDPQVLQTITAGTRRACASKCIGQSKCKSFRFISGSSRCILYSKYLDAMQTEFTSGEDNYLSGRLFERECFSSNCDIIDACGDTQNKCEVVDSDYSVSYESTWIQYACSYGRTAKTYGVDFQTKYFNGSLPACKAANKCMYYQSKDGSIDLHYHIPSDQWVCILFADQPPFEYRYGEPSSKEQHVVRTRYSVRNESVGAGYGYWLSDYYVAI